MTPGSGNWLAAPPSSSAQSRKAWPVPASCRCPCGGRSGVEPAKRDERTKETVMVERVPPLSPHDPNVDAEQVRRIARRVAARLGLTVDAHAAGDFDAYASPASTLNGGMKMVVREDRRVVVIDFGGRVDIDVALCRVEVTVSGERETKTLDAVTGFFPRLRDPQVELER